MRVADVQNEVLAFLSCTVTDAVDLEGLAEAFGHADDHVVYERTGKAVKGTVDLLIIGTGDMNNACVEFNLHVGCHGHLKCALGALDGDMAAVDLNFYSCGDGNGSSTNSRHDQFLLTIRTRGLRRRHELHEQPYRS